MMVVIFIWFGIMNNWYVHNVIWDIQLMAISPCWRSDCFKKKKNLIWQKQEVGEKGGTEGDGGSYKSWLDEITHTGLLALAAESSGVMSHNTLRGPLGNERRVNLKYQSFFCLVLLLLLRCVSLTALWFISSRLKDGKWIESLDIVRH